MGTKIKFRGQYEPYIVAGVRPYDPSSVFPRKRSGAKYLRRNDSPARVCSSCSRPIFLGWPFYLTKAGTSRHDQCP